ncbi:MAG TPA: hypothetical protein DCS05_07075, partial [Nitrospiraceae bacterium]|nr:hypothetical protein [Nitrospiraceae bacterium]
FAEVRMGNDRRGQGGHAARGIEVLGGFLERSVFPHLGALGAAIRRATPAGRIMAIIGLLAAAACDIMILADSVSIRVEDSRGALLAVKEKVLVRSRPSAKSASVVTVREGQRMTPLGYEGGWYKVRTRGTVGWVAQDMVARQGNKKAVIEYEMKGYGIAFFAAAALIAAGILLRQRSS